MKRQIPIVRRCDGKIGCDVCGGVATVVRPESRNRELAYYCNYDAARSLGWLDHWEYLV